ncbi:MAG: putative Histidine kinase [Thermoleophilia bacterium]|nr:putative Histidine kinase [Thermoleophilia bacterium]
MVRPPRGGADGRSRVTRKRIERSPQDTADLTRLIIERAHSAFVSMDADGLITEWNPSAERMFGWTRDEVAGRRVGDVVMPERYREAHERGLARFLATGDGPVLDRTVELEGQHRDGREFPIALTISPIELGGEYSFHAFIQDVSQRQEAVRLIERANDELLRADELKSRFMAMASHELRTPLTVISGFTDTMLTMNGQLTSDQRQEYLQIIDRQARRLTRLVDDLLTLSKVESHGLRSDPTTTLVAVAIEDTLRELGVPDIIVRCPPQLAALADADHLHQIVANYVSNAVKYGSEPIEIVVEQREESVLIAVCDQGDGVPVDFAPRLFERFERALHTEDIEGSGLGLSIVRGLALAQGGDVWHEPNSPRGSRFYLSLPCAVPGDDGSER